MKKYEYIGIGDFHLNHCDDFILTVELDSERILCAVMDGCTMGTDSYIASGITGKILRKIAKEISYRNFNEKRDFDLILLLKEVMSILFQELRLIKNQLQLERDELLSTLILVLVDFNSNIAESITIGDGLIYCNGELFEYEQNDKPDYLGYHLEENFENWYSKQKQRLSLKNVKDLSISSDGIFTFRNYQSRTKILKKPHEIVEFLLKDTEGFENESMLKKKILIINNEWGYKSTDDLGIIRLITD